MNLLKWLACLGLIVFTSRAHTDEGIISLHLGCDQVTSDCVEFQFSSGEEKTVLAKKDPEMTLSQTEISEAEFLTNQHGQEQLLLRLEKAAAEKFGQVTGANIRKQLIIVANGKAIFDPHIHEAITGGSIVISSGVGDRSQYFDGLPWLKKMAEDKRASREGLSRFSIVSFIALGLLLIGGSIYFAFFRRKAA